MKRFAERGHSVYYFACVGASMHRAAPMAGQWRSELPVYVYTLPYSPYAQKLTGLRRWLAALKVAKVVNSHGIRDAVYWYYHPALFALGYAQNDRAIVYDVMDHFGSFETQNNDFYFDELTMLAEADALFAGGRSLEKHLIAMQQELSDTPDDLTTITCLPSGIDLDHFTQVNEVISTEKHPRPIFGYFGAVDERLDWNIIVQLANATDGSVIIAGPHIQPPPDNLPANIQFPGAVPYTELPSMLAKFDVALIPFRLTPLVQHVSHTKTPEYRAGGKPVVSTAIPDVITDYGDIVRIATTAEDFVAACLDYIAAPPDPVFLKNEAIRRAMSWEQIAVNMEHNITAFMNRNGSNR